MDLGRKPMHVCKRAVCKQRCLLASVHLWNRSGPERKWTIDWFFPPANTCVAYQRLPEVKENWIPFHLTRPLICVCFIQSLTAVKLPSGTGPEWIRLTFTLVQYQFRSWSLHKFPGGLECSRPIRKGPQINISSISSYNCELLHHELGYIFLPDIHWFNTGEIFRAESPFSNLWWEWAMWEQKECVFCFHSELFISWAMQ